MHVGLQKGNEIGPGLADNEMVHVEQLGNASKRGVTICIRCMSPVAEVGRVGRSPRNNVAVSVFAQDGGFGMAI